MFFKELVHVYRYMKKTKDIELPGSYYFTFFVLSNLLTENGFHFRRTGQLTSSEHAKCAFIYYYICLPFCVTYCILMQLDSQ